MKQGVPQASLRAQWDDHAELRNSAKRSAAPEYRASEAQAGTKTPMKQGGPLVRFAHIEGPKGWSGEHTERSAVRSHGTPGR